MRNAIYFFTFQEYTQKMLNECQHELHTEHQRTIAVADIYIREVDAQSLPLIMGHYQIRERFPVCQLVKFMLNNMTYGLKPIKIAETARADFVNLSQIQKRFRTFRSTFVT